MFYPDDPKVEVSNIKLAFKTLREDKDKKMLVTDYNAEQEIMSIKILQNVT